MTAYLAFIATIATVASVVRTYLAWLDHRARRGSIVRGEVTTSAAPRPKGSGSGSRRSRTAGPSVALLPGESIGTWPADEESLR